MSPLLTQLEEEIKKLDFYKELLIMLSKEEEAWDLDDEIEKLKSIAKKLKIKEKGGKMLYIVVKLSVEENPKNSDVVFGVYDNLEEAKKQFENFADELREMQELYDGELQEVNEYEVRFDADTLGIYSIVSLKEITLGELEGVTF